MLQCAFPMVICALVYSTEVLVSEHLANPELRCDELQILFNSAILLDCNRGIYSYSSEQDNFCFAMFHTITFFPAFIIQVIKDWLNSLSDFAPHKIQIMDSINIPISVRFPCSPEDLFSDLCEVGQKPMVLQRSPDEDISSYKEPLPLWNFQRHLSGWKRYNK